MQFQPRHCDCLQGDQASFSHRKRIVYLAIVVGHTEIGDDDVTASRGVSEMVQFASYRLLKVGRDEASFYAYRSERWEVSKPFLPRARVVLLNLFVPAALLFTQWLQ